MSMQSRSGEPTERTTVTLPASLAVRVRVKAKTAGRSVSSIVREALQAYFEGQQLPEPPSFTGIGRSDGSGIARRAEELLAEGFGDEPER